MHFILVWTRRSGRQPLQPFRCCRGFTPSILIILILITLSILNTNIYQCSSIFSSPIAFFSYYGHRLLIQHKCFARMLSKSPLNRDMQNVKCKRICPRKALSLVFTLSLILPPPHHIANWQFFRRVGPVLHCPFSGVAPSNRRLESKRANRLPSGGGRALAAAHGS